MSKRLLYAGLSSPEGSELDHVSANYIYVWSHSICHSKFCPTCHIVNHYSKLNAGYELRRPRKALSSLHLL